MGAEVRAKNGAEVGVEMGARLIPDITAINDFGKSENESLF